MQGRYQFNSAGGGRKKGTALKGFLSHEALPLLLRRTSKECLIQGSVIAQRDYLWVSRVHRVIPTTFAPVSPPVFWTPPCCISHLVNICHFPFFRLDITLQTFSQANEEETFGKCEIYVSATTCLPLQSARRSASATWRGVRETLCYQVVPRELSGGSWISATLSRDHLTQRNHFQPTLGRQISLKQLLLHSLGATRDPRGGFSASLLSLEQWLNQSTS